MNPILGQMSCLKGNVAGISFNPESGGYDFDSFNSGGTYSIVASQPVTWNWTKSGTSTVTPANGASGSSLSVTWASKANGSLSVTAKDASNNIIGSWTISWSSVG